MPSTGIRAFVARFITDQSDFKTDAIVDELNAAETAAKDLDDTSLDSLEAELETVETAAKSLDDVSTAGLQAELDQLRYAADRAATDIDSDMRKATSAVVDDDGMRGTLKNQGSEIGSEFSENIGEAFRGGSLQDTILETFTSLGPALGVAGIAVGAGAAIVNGIISGQKARAEALKAQMADMVQTVRDGLLAVNREARLANLRAAEDDPESIYNKILAKAKAANLPTEVVAALMFGTQEQRQAAAVEYQSWYTGRLVKLQELDKAMVGADAEARADQLGAFAGQTEAINKAIQEQVDLKSDSNRTSLEQLRLEQQLGLLSQKDVENIERRQKALDTTSQTTEDLVEKTRRLADEQRRYSDASADAADNQSTINTLLRDRQSIGSGNVLTGRQGE